MESCAEDQGVCSAGAQERTTAESRFVTFLVDTCVLSEAIRPAPDTGVDAWRKAQDPEGVFTSSITVGELRYGIDRLPQGRKRDALQRWYVATFTPGFGGRIFAFDPDADTHWATVRANHPEAAMIDSQSAAIAIARRLTPVTRHVRDCGFEGLSILNPWSI